MLYCKQAVQDNIRNREGKRVFYLGKGDQLTSDARDFLNRERIAILPASEAKPTRYQLLGGGFMEKKPEHMTHLNAQVLVPKTHPRIAFRGMVDELEARLLLCQVKVPRWKKELGETLALARKLLRCDVLEEPLEQEKLCGLDELQLREHSHRPQDFYGQPHFMPSFEDGPGVLELNLLRTAVRQTELAAARAFTDGEGLPTREDILRSLNRMSSMVYILMIREKKAGRNGYGTGNADG